MISKKNPPVALGDHQPFGMGWRFKVFRRMFFFLRWVYPKKCASCIFLPGTSCPTRRFIENLIPQPKKLWILLVTTARSYNGKLYYLDLVEQFAEPNFLMDMLKTHFSIEQLSLGPSCGGRWLDAKAVSPPISRFQRQKSHLSDKTIGRFFCRFFSVGLLFQGIYLKNPP